MACYLLVAPAGCGAQIGDATPLSEKREGTQLSRAPIAAVERTRASDPIDRYSMDAGVVFIREASYRCIPLAEFGIETADQVESVDSSCECVRPRLVSYLDDTQVSRDAVRLDFRCYPASLSGTLWQCLSINVHW